jgi:hypothetical protein
VTEPAPGRSPAGFPGSTSRAFGDPARSTAVPRCQEAGSFGAAGGTVAELSPVDASA